MEANNKKKKTIFILTILVIAAVAICVIGIFAKKAYDRHQEEIRIQAIETKNGEIDQEYENFEKEQDRDKKLETLKNEVANATEYEKTEGAYEECSAHYAKMIAQMKSYFVNDYDVTIKTISDEIGDGVEEVEDKDKLKKACSEFATFQDTLKKDYENHGTIEEDKFKEYNDTVDTYVKKYSDRVSAIEKAEEEAKKKAEEEAKKKAEEEAKKKAEEEAAAAQESSGSGGSSSYYDDSYDYSYDDSSSYSGGSSSSGSSGSGSDYSGSNDYSNGSSSGGNNGIPSSANYGWIEGSDGNRIENYYDPSTGDTWDMDGNYSGNMNDWLWD